MQRDGQTVEVHVYPGTHYDFDNACAYFKYFLGAATVRDCPQILISVQHDVYYRLPDGEKYTNSQVMQVDYAHCTTRGVSTSASLEQVKRAEADINTFLVKAMDLLPR